MNSIKIAHNRTPDEQIINRLRELELEFVGRKLNKKSNTVVIYKCPKHPQIGNQEIVWYHLKNKKTQGCPFCGKTPKKRTHKSFLADMEKIHPHLKFLTEYTKREAPIDVVCTIHNYKWTTTAHSLYQNQGCPKCGIEKRSLSRIKTHDEFVSDLKQVNPNIEVLSKYRGSHDMITVRCKLDECVWRSYACNVLNGSAGCPSCRNTSNEYKIRTYLQSKGFDVWSQYRFDDCRSILPLPFDMYLPDYNILIEYDGEGHYMPIQWSGLKSENAENNMLETQMRDKIKDEYCAKNGIPLIRVPYWERDNYKEFLKQELLNYNVAI